ncbi:MAG TPA: bifunctional glutamate N-acetyltransferase/amino-acid acetyltransferase ArgJ [Terriglobia bacterium]|nr:bifunctional glutamate N-acetyltransferase/amino-acid acetyltransferase ArgJ [Terriglobia bacterium]
MRPWDKVEADGSGPVGFLASSARAGIKRDPKALDVALIFSEGEQTTAAGVFTTNRVAAAPVSLSRQHLKASHGHARAIVVNSGNANACTGSAGEKCAAITARTAAKLLGIEPQQALLASTGVIGVRLEPKSITRQLPGLVRTLSPEGFPGVARAIMTTDRFPKLYALQSIMGGKPVRLLGMTKGAGMIHPRMATMLAFVMTDAIVKAPDLQKMLQTAADASFNRITVDGDTSTNDTVIALASGLSGVNARMGTPGGARFTAGLTELCEGLARMIVQDGEGAKKLVTVQVQGARTEADADRIARAIANSPLVKTALAGNDPNWGRILCAAGYSGAEFDPTKVDLHVNRLLLCRKGVSAGFSKAAARAELDQPQLTLRIDLHQGRASARMWTCDLTHEYITINASYTT